MRSCFSALVTVTSIITVFAIVLKDEDTNLFSYIFTKFGKVGPKEEKNVY